MNDPNKRNKKIIIKNLLQGIDNELNNINIKTINIFM